MLHTVKHSPFSHQALAHALREFQPDDRLLLWQDGVIAATVAQSQAPLGQASWWQAPLQTLANSQRLYVMAEDLQARGLSQAIGQPISMLDWVDLVAKWGSPQAW
ncbi:sulfurtransferase complex subunit TusB [Oceanisphaera sp. IT1-181]|uniref:sulfurtransferase complex subunit TusB n=1 Tax=Oceanisphaera sp. IT1-181 TaxID=3081199 RepID=UPI0029CAAA5E|nr:sulfurtransferase complex subunit TusB [Oceanisphaera sp. IT1-181]